MCSAQRRPLDSIEKKKKKLSSLAPFCELRFT